MNVVMSSPVQNSNAPSFIGLAKRLDIQDKELKEKVAAINKLYNEKVASMLYMLAYLKTLEKIENDVLTIQRGFLSTTYANPGDKSSFNTRLELIGAPYISVQPIPV
jgi:hypothetical protein